MKKKKEILIGVSGGISAYKACEIIRSCQKKNYGVTVAMTKEAAEFITPLTFRTLTARKVALDMFSDDVDWDPQHIALADLADLILVAPATANFIAKLAAGICDDILSCVICASRAKIVVAPAMNDRMFKHPAVQANLKTIRSFGYKIIPPIKGSLACGKVGIGHLAGVGTIVDSVEKLLK